MNMEDDKVKIFLNEPNEDSFQDKCISMYEKLISEELCVNNNLLGDFIDGKYIVSKNIKEELVIGKKIQIEATEDKIYAILRTKFATYHLELLFDKFGEDKSIAKLYLVERIKEYGEDVRTFVAEYISANRIDFKQTAREAFNIYIVSGEFENETEEFKNIDQRLENFKKLKNADIEFVIEMYSEIYVEKMLKALEKMGPLGQKIIKEYKEMLEKNNLDKEKVTTKVYTKMRGCLDKAIKDNGGSQTLSKDNQEIKKIILDYVEPVKAYKEIALRDPILVKPEEKKDQGKSKTVPKGTPKIENNKGGKTKEAPKSPNNPKKKSPKKDKEDNNKKKNWPYKPIANDQPSNNPQKEQSKKGTKQPEINKTIKNDINQEKQPEVFARMFNRGGETEKSEKGWNNNESSEGKNYNNELVSKDKGGIEIPDKNDYELSKITNNEIDYAVKGIEERQSLDDPNKQKE